jgi:hypothetical protein
MSAGASVLRWTCGRCGVAVGRIDGQPVPLPETWETSSEGEFCLSCRRWRAAEAAVEKVPSDAGPEGQAKARRRGMIEFEVRRAPDASNRVIAKACRTSTATVAAARRSLGLGDGPAPEPES